LSSQPGLRMTQQHRVILEEVRTADSHPAADELYERVRSRLPRLSLGTVYRNLELLCQQGLVQKIELAGSQRRFDGNVQAHYHIRCVRCGLVEDLPIQPPDGLEDAARAATDYEVTGHRLKFFGICPECKHEAHREPPR